MKLVSSPLERQQNCCGKIQLCGNSGFHSLTSKGRSQSVQSHTPIFSNPSHARSLMNLAAAWLLGCGFLCSSLSKGEETVDDSAKKENSHEAGQGITIVKALYGSREQFATGDAKDVTEKAREYVADGTLHIPHTRQAFGDPHPYKSKILRLTYLVHGKGDAFGQPYVMERPAGLVNLLVPEIDGNRPLIKHVNQGKGAYCTSASILMALQHTTGMDLSSEDLLSVLASIRSAACGSGKLGNKVDGFCEILNIESKELEYNIQTIEQRQEQEAFAKNKLLEEIVPFLHKGCAVMVINSERGLSHAVLATSYDSSSKNFVIHDPLKQGAEIWSISKLAKCWPRDLNGVMLLRSQLIVNQEFHNKVLVPLPANKEIDVMVSELVKIKFTDALTFPQQRLKNVFSDFAICPLHTLWEKGRKADSVQGTSLWLKIKVAAGDPACLFWDDGEGGKRVVAVTGYRGGYKDFGGDLRITWLGENGDLVHSWVTGAELLQKGKSPRDCGGDSFYIIYPKKPLVAP